MIELTLLKALSNKDAFNQYRHLLNPKTLSQQSLTVLKDYEVYFSKFEEHEQIDFNLFPTYFFQTRHPYLDEKSIMEYKEIIRMLSELKVNGEIKDIYLNFEQQEFYSELQNQLNNNISINELQDKVQGFLTQLPIKTDEIPTLDVDDIFDSVDRKGGLRWRLKCLDTWFSEGGLNKSDFVLVAATPGSGKTAFCINEAVHMARQLKESSVYYLSNEGSEKKVAARAYCNVLQCTESEIQKHRQAAHSKYVRELGGPNKLVFVNIQGWTADKIERFISNKAPGLIVIDMLDNVHGFEHAVKQGPTERYNRLYQWALELSTKLCPVIAASQLNKVGYNNTSPSINDLRGSQIDKQGAVQFQIMIGSIQGQENVRYISLVKDKLGIGYKNVGVRFDPLRSLFV